MNKGQINLEFLTSAFVFLIIIGTLLALGSDVLPNFSDSIETSTLHMEAYTVSTAVLSTPGSTSTGDTEWHKSDAKVDDVTEFGLSNSSDNFLVIDENKLRNLSSFDFRSSESYVNYSEFKDLTGVKNQYYFNFTWQPVVYSPKSIGAFPKDQLGEDLLLYHEFEGNYSSSTVKDSSGNNNDGTNNGAEKLRNGTYNTNSFYFNRSESDFTAFPDLDNTNSSISVSFWMKKVGSWKPEENIFVIGSDNGGSVRELKIGNHPSNDFMFSYYNGSAFKGLFGSTPPKPEEWTHVTGTYNDSSKTWKLYFNGELVSQTVEDTEIHIPDQINNGVGHGGAGSPHSFNGNIDEFRVYERVLTQDDVKNLMDVRSKIDLPTSKEYKASAAEQFLGSKLIDGERTFYLITRDSEEVIYVSDNWDFNSSKPLGRGERVNISNRSMKIRDIRYTDISAYTIFQQHIKSFGPARDSDSTIIKIDRMALMKGEPLRVEVLAW